MSDLVPAHNLCELIQECHKKVRDRLRELDHEVRGKAVSIPSWDRIPKSDFISFCLAIPIMDLCKILALR